MMRGLTQRRLIVSGLALQAAGFSVAVIVAGAVLHRLFGLATPVALNLFFLGFIGAAVALILAAFALWRIWQHGYRGTGSALVATAVAVAILMWPISLLPTIRQLPSINDVTTDVMEPPEFTEVALLRPPGSNPVQYPGAEFAEQQKAAYPDLRTLVVEREAGETFSLVAQALTKMRMTIVREAAPDGRTGDVGYLEAVDRTLVLGFYDDVVVRVAASGGRSRVDVRSASRFGEHDLGSNAERVRAIMMALVERVQASVPTNRRRAKP